MPLIASILIGVGAKVGLGFAAAAAKKLMEPPAASPAAASFPSLLTAESATPSAAVGTAAPASIPPARVLDDLPGRLAAEGLAGVALGPQARGFGGPALLTNRYDDGPLAAYRRLEQAP